MAADEAQHFPAASLDALPPDAMAHRAEQVGFSKTELSAAKLIPLAVLAGAFIGLGAVFATTVTAGGTEIPFGVTRLLAGVTFSLGLVLVVVAGAELSQRPGQPSSASSTEPHRGKLRNLESSILTGKAAGELQRT